MPLSIGFRLLLALSCFGPVPAALAQTPAPGHKLAVLIVDGMNNHDWQAGTRAIRSILEGTNRFTVEVCTYPKKPDFSRYDVVVNNFNGGHTPQGIRWPRDTEEALERYVRDGGGLAIYHAANNAFLEWPEYNRMIGLGWRDKSFGPGLAVVDGKVITIPQGSGADPGHGPRHDFEMYVFDKDHPITRGLPDHWLHSSEQLTHGQHGPAEDVTVLTYANSEVTHLGEPMDWVSQYGKGRVYVTMLGHTWKDEPNPNLDDVSFQALFARGVEWAASGRVTLAPDLGWKLLFNGQNLDGWEPRGTCVWTANNGILLGQRVHTSPTNSWPLDQKGYNSWLYRQAWLYTTQNFDEFDLHVEYWIPRGGNSGVSIRDVSRAHYAIGEADAAHPELAGPVKSTPAHIGYEIQILDDDSDSNPSGSIYSLVPAKTGVHRPGEWNSLDIESRHELIRVRLNGQVVAEGPGDPARSKTGPIGLQLHDLFTFAMFRNIRIREIASSSK